MENLPKQKTKIVATIGPASADLETLQALLEAGLSIARINFAHGDFASHEQTIANVRAAAEKTGRRVAIFGDLPGPKMRIGQLAEEPIQLEIGQTFTLQTEPMIGNRERVYVQFDGLTDAVKPGDAIYMNDGYIQLRVESVEADTVHCLVRVGGELRSYKGVNFPGIDLGISAFTDQDREFLAFAAGQRLDGVSQSFVATAADIKAVREAAAALDYHPLLIAKIERAGALEHLEEIIAAADGIMVARGDLGVEIPIEDIPAQQKAIILQTNLAGKPVITATQMLESMTNNRRPTRAEVTDVANAILDGTDCVMLSGETAIGKYPVEAVATMARVAAATERTTDRETIALVDVLRAQEAKGALTTNELISYSVFRMAKRLQPTAVIVPSRSGASARRTTRFRLPQWIIAPSRNPACSQKLQFSYGVFPLDAPADVTDWKSYFLDLVADFDLDDGLLMLVEGAGTLNRRDTKRIEIIDLSQTALIANP
ncbi:MAG: pyruvate kinase [Ardenticatenales bacterium]|nr:pyruvate kinase [Ardenticatenales bacterium]